MTDKITQSSLAAYRALASRGETILVTPQQRKEIEEHTGFSIELLAEMLGVEIKDAPKDVPDAVLVCCPYDADNPMVLPDNATANCDWCGRIIQHRPNAAQKVKVCTVCISERSEEDN